MFQSAYQDGDSVEVFSPAGKDPAVKWNLVGKVGRLYDKGVKGWEPSSFAINITEDNTPSRNTVNTSTI